MTWTRKRPTSPGWYWYQTKERSLRIVQLIPEPGQYDSRRLVLSADYESTGSYIKVDLRGGQWAGPIPVPK